MVSLHKKTKENLIIALSDMKHTELDLVIVICGWEGWGKSFMSRGIAKFCAMFLGSSFDVGDIYFDLNEYIEGSIRGGKFKINVLDEARKVLNKRRAMSRDVVGFTNYLSECRSKRQVHIICVPSYSDLDRYIVAWRLNMLFCIDKDYRQNAKTESGYLPKFGTYRLFVNKKQLIYYYDKGYNYYPPRYEARAEWTPVDAFTKEQLIDYQKKKDDSTLKKYLEKPEPKATPASRYLKTALTFIKDYNGLDHKDIFTKLEIPRSSYFYFLKMKEDGSLVAES